VSDRCCPSCRRPWCLLTVEELCELLNISSRTVYRMVAEGRLPPPLRLSHRVARWHEEDVFAWLEKERAAATKVAPPEQ